MGLICPERTSSAVNLGCPCPEDSTVLLLLALGTQSPGEQNPGGEDPTGLFPSPPTDLWFWQPLRETEAEAGQWHGGGEGSAVPAHIPPGRGRSARSGPRDPPGLPCVAPGLLNEEADGTQERAGVQGRVLDLPEQQGRGPEQSSPSPHPRRECGRVQMEGRRQPGPPAASPGGRHPSCGLSRASLSPGNFPGAETPDLWGGEEAHLWVLRPIQL